MSRTRTTILLADDHSLVRGGIRELLHTQPDLVVVGEAGNGDEAVALAQALRPDVILLDVEMPGQHVTTTVGKLRALVPSARIVILTMHESPRLLTPPRRGGSPWLPAEEHPGREPARRRPRGPGERRARS